MGICSSSSSTQIATAKLILTDGRLQEYPYPVKVSYVLAKNPSCFIVNSDDMDFDDIVTAVDDDEDLHPGQLYFALPLDRLRTKLHAEDMAALAVKATSALAKSASYGGFHRNSVSPVEVGGEKGCERVIPRAAVRRGRGRGRGRGKFTVMLTAIPE